MANGLVVAAPRSGSGKTVLTLGLLAALRARGINVAPAKTGPDYIDATILSRAAGAEAINLDPWAMAPARMRALASAHAASADLLLVEGVMGLFDGAADGRGSTADLAAALGLPVILVVDAEKQSHSIAALVHGFATWRLDVKVAGLILNRAATTRHERMLRNALVAVGIPILGVIPRRDALVLPDRHLGLVLPDEVANFETVVSSAAAVVREYVDLDVLLSLSAPLSRDPTSRSEAEGEDKEAASPDVGARGSHPPRLRAVPPPDKREGASTANSERGDGPSPASLREAPSPQGGEGTRAAVSQSGSSLREAKRSGGGGPPIGGGGGGHNHRRVGPPPPPRFAWSPSPALRTEEDKEGPVPDSARSPLPPSGRERQLPPLGQHIAIARDEAFAFIYPHWLEDWRAAGAELSFFSPLSDESPDASADAVFLPGGYPELHAERLAHAETFMAGLRASRDEGALIYGECGGFMVLGETLTDKDGRTWPMAGLLPVATRADRPRRTLGYRRLSHESPLPWPKVLTGHEFHYSAAVAQSRAPLFSATDALGTVLAPTGAVVGRVMGSYAHVIDVAS